MSLLGCTTRVNTALSLCGVMRAALYFFALVESPEVEAGLAELVSEAVSVAAAQALAFLLFLGQLSAKWPDHPQNMQSLLSICLLHSSGVNFLSLPSLLGSGLDKLEASWLGVAGLDILELVLDFP